MFLRLLPRAPWQTNPAVIRLPPLPWRRDTQSPKQVIACQAAIRSLHLGQRALKDDLAAAFARRRTDFDQPVGRPQHRFFMFHHDHGILALLQPPNGVNQLPHISAGAVRPTVRPARTAC